MTSASSSDSAARFLFFVVVLLFAARFRGFNTSSSSISDVAGVSDCTEVFVLNKGDITVDGVAVADASAADFARVRCLVSLAMSGDGGSRQARNNGGKRLRGKGREQRGINPNPTRNALKPYLLHLSARPAPINRIPTHLAHTRTKGRLTRRLEIRPWSSWREHRNFFGLICRALHVGNDFTEITGISILRVRANTL